MVKPTYQFVAQMFAAIGVIVSLGFVAYELKQSRDLAIAELNISQSYGIGELFLSLLEQEHYFSAQKKLAGAGGELTWEERRALDLVHRYAMNIRHNNWLLDEMGLALAGEWEASEESIKEEMADPGHYEAWMTTLRGTGGSPAWKQRLLELWVEVHGEVSLIE